MGFPDKTKPILGSRITCALPWLVGLLMTLPGESPAEQATAERTSLNGTNWSASALSHHACGTACWVMDLDGSLRVEVLREAGHEPEGTANNPVGDLADLDPLLTWTGDGWTLVLGPDDQGTLNAWGREWRSVPVSLAQLVRLITTSLGLYPAGPPEFPFALALGHSGSAGGIARPKILDSVPARPAKDEVWRYQLAALDLETTGSRKPPSFRRTMTARGRGTGGQNEILELRWTSAGDSGGSGLRVRSSRRPGALHLDRAWKQAVISPEPEIFLPLWPLSQFIETR